MIPLARIAGAIDTSVTGTLYVKLTGNWNASIPIKCMAQMPIPIVIAPAASHERLTIVVSAALIRPARPKEAYAPREAISTESATRSGL
jgi:hypothetical protein